MQTKKVKYHLKRIETIVDLHNDGLTRLDRDILLEDIRRLYDLVSEADISSPGDMPAVSQITTDVPPAGEPVKKAELEQQTPVHNQKIASESQAEAGKSQEIKESGKSQAYEEVDLSSTEVPYSEEPEHTPTTITYENNTPGEIESVSETPQHESIAAIDKNALPGASSAEPKEKEHYEDVMVEEVEDHPELFNFESSSDLSDRLANSKIEHLNKILTINDKILYINQLFGGEAIPFQESLKKFEHFYTYEEARKYASKELVTEYNWTDKEKKEIVRQFMRQVKRLYS